MFKPLTPTQKDEAINVFNKPFNLLTLEEAFHLGALLREIELSHEPFEEDIFSGLTQEEYDEVMDNMRPQEDYNPYLLENTQEDINLEEDLAGKYDKD